MAATMEPIAGESRSAHRLAMLLAIGMFINYVDRGNLATAAPVLTTELHLSATQLGILLSAFYWTYAVSQLGAGWLAERFLVHRVIAVGFAVWSFATIFTGLVSGFAALLFLRLLLGLGESVVFPCSSKMLSQHVAVDRRGRANGAIAVGLALGPAFGTYVGGMILSRFGWRPLFISLGALSLVWLWPWLAGPARELSKIRPASVDRGPSYRDIVRRRAAIGAGLGHFCSNYIFYFVLSWLPLYLVQERGFSIERMAVVGGTVYLVHAAAAYATGLVLDRWIQSGATSNRVYKSAMVASQLGSALCLLGAVLANPLWSTVFLLLASASFGLGTPTLYAAAQTLAGPTATGRWVGFQNFVGNLAGIVGPAITGVLVDRTGHFFSAFALAIAVALVGVFSWAVVVPQIAPIEWGSTPAAPLGAIPAI